MSVVADVQEVFACAGKCKNTNVQQQSFPTRSSGQVARQHMQWFLSLANRLHVYGWKKKTCEKDCLNVKLSHDWVRAFPVSIDLSLKAAAQQSGPKVWTLLDKVVLTKRFIMNNCLSAR